MRQPAAHWQPASASDRNTFPANNPKINAPLSKPELEALNELVFLQNKTELGRKWVSYHDALLKQESARRLNETAATFGGLADRAADADQIKDAIKFAADFYKEVTGKYGEKATVLAKELLVPPLDCWVSPY